MPHRGAIEVKRHDRDLVAEAMRTMKGSALLCFWKLAEQRAPDVDRQAPSRTCRGDLTTGRVPGLPYEQIFVKCAEGVLRIPDMDFHHPDIGRGMEGNFMQRPFIVLRAGIVAQTVSAQIHV